MRTPVSRQATLSATRVPFLAPPAPILTRLCVCGAELTLEMEKDADRCVDCSFQAAVRAYEEGV